MEAGEQASSSELGTFRAVDEISWTEERFRVEEGNVSRILSFKKNLWS